jgi:hypothetical protein
VNVARTAADVGDETQNALGLELEPLAQQTIALAYPGARLVVSGGVLYLLDASGRWERARIQPVARSEDGARFALVLGFPDREAALAGRIQAQDTTGRCRTSAEVLVADVDPVTHAASRLQRVDVEREAVATGVLGLEFAPQRGAPEALVASYLGSYDTDAWHGEVRWYALISGDSLHVTRRVPDLAIRVDEKAATMEAAFERRDYDPYDPYGFAADPNAVQRLSVFDGDESYPHLAAPKRIVVPRGADGLPNGWTLLDML